MACEAKQRGALEAATFGGRVATSISNLNFTASEKPYARQASLPLQEPFVSNLAFSLLNICRSKMFTLRLQHLSEKRSYDVLMETILSCSRPRTHPAAPSYTLEETAEYQRGDMRTTSLPACMAQECAALCNCFIHGDTCASGLPDHPQQRPFRLNGSLGRYLHA